MIHVRVGGHEIGCNMCVYMYEVTAPFPNYYCRDNAKCPSKHFHTVLQKSGMIQVHCMLLYNSENILMLFTTVVSLKIRRSNFVNK